MVVKKDVDAEAATKNIPVRSPNVPGHLFDDEMPDQTGAY